MSLTEFGMILIAVVVFFGFVAWILRPVAEAKAKHRKLAEEANTMPPWMRNVPDDIALGVAQIPTSKAGEFDPRYAQVMLGRSLKLDPANLRNALNVVYKDRLQSTLDRLHKQDAIDDRLIAERVTETGMQALGAMLARPEIASIVGNDTDGPRNPAQEAADDAAYVAKLARNAGVKSERMYADSGHQVVNPEVMKRVLNEQFGDLNSEQEVWTVEAVEVMFTAIGAESFSFGIWQINRKCMTKLVNRLNALAS